MITGSGDHPLSPSESGCVYSELFSFSRNLYGNARPKKPLAPQINLTATYMPRNSHAKASGKSADSSHPRFESAKIDALFPVLDAIAWMDAPTSTQIAQFAGIDPRTAGKLLKNAIQIGLIDKLTDRTFALVLPYPYKGTLDQKHAVVREALVRLPILTSIRQFLKLGDTIQVSLRKSATMEEITPFNAKDFSPLLQWASTMDALKADLMFEDLLDAAAESRIKRHELEKNRRIAFLSHSGKDKAFVRQLSIDLTQNGVSIWLDEQRIRVGDSIPERIAQGLAESDYFLLAISHNSVESEWVKKELNNALVAEVQRRNIRILPLRLDDATIPQIIADKKYADFSISYKTGLAELLSAIRGDVDG